MDLSRWQRRPPHLAPFPRAVPPGTRWPCPRWSHCGSPSTPPGSWRGEGGGGQPGRSGRYPQKAHHASNEFAEFSPRVFPNDNDHPPSFRVPNDILKIILGLCDYAILHPQRNEETFEESYIQTATAKSPPSPFSTNRFRASNCPKQQVSKTPSYHRLAHVLTEKKIPSRGKRLKDRGRKMLRC